MGASSSIIESNVAANENKFNDLIQSGLNVEDAYHKLKNDMESSENTNHPNNTTIKPQLKVISSEDTTTTMTSSNPSTSPKNLRNYAIKQLSQTLHQFVQSSTDVNSGKRRKSQTLNLEVILNKDKIQTPTNLPMIASTSLSSDFDEKVPPPMLSRKPTLFVQVASDKNIYEYNENDVNEMKTISTSSQKNHVMFSETMKISPRGTFTIGNWKIRETGLSPASVENETMRSSLSDDSSGSRKFIEIGSLGGGASSVVMEAIHIPTLTIVALKMLQVYNIEKQQQLSRELEVLYKNLGDLKLIDQRLESADEFHENYDVEKVDLNSTTNSNPDKSQLTNDDMLKTKTKTCPNVLSFYNAFVDPNSGMINVVIEYMDGGSLQDLANRGGCQDEDILADIAYQALLGLKFLHDNKHVHRDIKPANILTSTKGIVKIADFGISKALDGNNVASSFVGTVCYMSPERITGGSYGFSSDIWSLGLTILTLANGKFPFDGRSTTAEGGYWGMMNAICDLPPPLPDSSLFSESFINFIDRCLQKKDESRATADELLQSPFISNWLRRLELPVDTFSILSDSLTSEESVLPQPSQPKRLSSLSVSGKFPSLTQKAIQLKSKTSGRIVYPTVPEMNFGSENSEYDEIRLKHLDRVLECLKYFIEEDYHIREKIHRNVDMVPRLKGSGLSKWKNLAEQLNLPFNVARVAAMAILGKYLS